MERINTAVIPEILARIVKELELINRWLDLRMGPENDEAIGKQEEWLNIYELCNMIPGRPRITTLRGWMYSEKIPYYISGGTPVFRKKEIEAWIPRAMRYGIGDFFTRSRKYRE